MPYSTSVNSTFIPSIEKNVSKWNTQYVVQQVQAATHRAAERVKLLLGVLAGKTRGKPCPRASYIMEWSNHLAPVVRRPDNAIHLVIHQINRNPVDKC